ncbi:hypothetical protein NIIDMKKI_59100 [Mycobacterium kansasii]|uniref:SLC26A/SulP transporter domain-containing protein n=1 Tax=Mycobacterium kansasii TaxID=1768 RepID=A0A7G1IJS0_MYCKA|nr:hypothetical protein NIIDMKKI_59100 [Mycobacterium kansasii]
MIAVGILTIALIASVESLLCAVGVDKLHKGPRTNFNREMIGQGSANMLSGLLGGLPVTGVIVRSSANVAAGARTRMSAILHGVWILLFASLFTNLVELIPKAALAGLLIVIGAQLVRLAHIRMALRTGNFVIYAITIVCVYSSTCSRVWLSGLRSRSCSCWSEWCGRPSRPSRWGKRPSTGGSIWTAR